MRDGGRLCLGEGKLAASEVASAIYPLPLDLLPDKVVNGDQWVKALRWVKRFAADYTIGGASGGPVAFNSSWARSGRWG